MKNSSTAATRAAVRVIATTSNRSVSNRARIGLPSRQTLTIPRTRPPGSRIGSRSRRAEVMPRSLAAPAAANGTIPASARPSALAGVIASGAPVPIPFAPSETPDTSDPSARSIWISRMPSAASSRASRPSSSARRVVAAAVVPSRSARSRCVTNSRMVVASPSTTSLIRRSVTFDVTIDAWADAVMPTSTRNAPKTRISRTGRRIRASEPNTGDEDSGASVDAPSVRGPRGSRHRTFVRPRGAPVGSVPGRTGRRGRHQRMDYGALTTTVPAIRSNQPRLRLSTKIQMYPR